MRKIFRKRAFAPNNLEINTKLVANLLPSDFVFKAKDISGSNLDKLLTGFAGELQRLEEKIFELSIEYNPEETTNLIEEWEKALRIPDGCFGIKNTPIETRRKQIVAKLALMNCQTARDFIYLAKYLGYNIAILYTSHYTTFPLKLPFILGDLNYEMFTFIVKFLDLDKPVNTFPLLLPFQLGSFGNVIRCLFNKLKPAYTKAIYVYKDF